jgi:hypothetical protein
VIRRFVFWLVVSGPINLGRFAPALFAWAIGCKEWREVDDGRLDSVD